MFICVDCIGGIIQEASIMGDPFGTGLPKDLRRGDFLDGNAVGGWFYLSADVSAADGAGVVAPRLARH
ncbi:MAG: hypothetical protein CMO26_18285 [Thiotrichales bacterium]|nr:hypothetical protein [Thiotrichales bacterium]|tara:strand:- start:238 stop:441 length:204 start_codon:yes stop_codon:yes gene_type:complete